MNIYMKCLVGYFIGINLISFGMFGADKAKARKGRWRIPEAQLLGTAALGGSFGAWLGMGVFHHKTRKLKFRLGIPAILALQVIVGIGICRFLCF